MPYKVLVIDDDPQFLDLMQSLLGGEGYQVTMCSDSHAAYQLVKATKPDVITLDLRMPGPGGWYVLEQVKTDAELQEIPVVVISAVGAEVAETRTRVEELQLQNVRILIKPFEIDELLAAVADAVVGRGASRR